MQQLQQREEQQTRARDRPMWVCRASMHAPAPAAPTVQPLDDLVAHRGLACGRQGLRSSLQRPAQQQGRTRQPGAVQQSRMWGMAAASPDAVPPATPMKNGSFLQSAAQPASSAAAGQAGRLSCRATSRPPACCRRRRLPPPTCGRARRPGEGCRPSIYCLRHARFG